MSVGAGSYEPGLILSRLIDAVETNYMAAIREGNLPEQFGEGSSFDKAIMAQSVEKAFAELVTGDSKGLQVAVALARAEPRILHPLLREALIRAVTSMMEENGSRLIEGARQHGFPSPLR